MVGAEEGALERAGEWREGDGNQSQVPSDSLLPHPRSSPHLIHHTLTHDFCAYEQTEENSHQPEPALQEQTPGQAWVLLNQSPQDLP